MKKNDEKQLKLIIFHKWILKMGGVETFIYNFCVTMRNYYDITVMYESSDINQLARMYPYVDIEKLDPTKDYHADIVINNTASWVKFPDNIHAEKIFTIIHCDYTDFMKFGVKPFLNVGHEFICVKGFARDSYEKLFNVKCDLIEGTLQPDLKPNKILHLISATRLTAEKGAERMKFFMQKLRESGIKFDWKVFTNDKFEVNYPEVMIMKPCYDVIDYIADADYLVQLSDTEALCLSVREALSVGTPVIVTDIPGFDYIEEGKMGYKFKLDMSNIDIDKIYHNIPTVKWSEDKQAIMDKWFEKLGNPVYIDKPIRENKKVNIRILLPYTDVVLGKYIEAGTIMEVDENRAFVLSNATYDRPQIAEII